MKNGHRRHDVIYKCLPIGILITIVIYVPVNVSKYEPLLHNKIIKIIFFFNLKNVYSNLYNKYIFMKVQKYQKNILKKIFFLNKRGGYMHKGDKGMRKKNVKELICLVLTLLVALRRKLSMLAD